MMTERGDKSRRYSFESQRGGKNKNLATESAATSHAGTSLKLNGGCETISNDGASCSTKANRLNRTTAGSGGIGDAGVRATTMESSLFQDDEGSKMLLDAGCGPRDQEEPLLASDTNSGCNDYRTFLTED